LKNIEKHGLDFANLDIEFFRDSVVVEAKERRLKAVGRFRDALQSSSQRLGLKRYRSFRCDPPAAMKGAFCDDQGE
jgi:hypothetical protein